MYLYLKVLPIPFTVGRAHPACLTPVVSQKARPEAVTGDRGDAGRRPRLRVLLKWWTAVRVGGHAGSTGGGFVSLRGIQIYGGETGLPRPSMPLSASRHRASVPRRSAPGPGDGPPGALCNDREPLIFTPQTWRLKVLLEWNTPIQTLLLKQQRVPGSLRLGSRQSICLVKGVMSTAD